MLQINFEISLLAEKISKKLDLFKARESVKKDIVN